LDKVPKEVVGSLAQVLGKGLAKLPRDQIIVATKVGRYGAETFDFSAERWVPAARAP
jgi:hypothetical protein